jgi:pSer/pThr/pTyr-binding forkhead associated (FHA) protein
MWILRTITGAQDTEGPRDLGPEMPEKTFRILPGSVRTLGRAAGADFIVDAALVSRVHCRFTALADGGLELRDLDSTNGTFVNGRRIESVSLASGDRMRIGRVELIALRET